MSKLSFQDNMFLITESAAQKHHITGLFILKKPKGAGRGFVAEIVQSLKDFSPVDIRYRSKLKFSNPSLSQEWVEEAEFDLDYHLRHYALPPPGNDSQLMLLANTIHAQGLDMDRPLWEYHIIDGLKGSRFAILGKQHHAMIDGAGAMKLMHTFFSSSPDDDKAIPPWAIGEKKKRKVKKKPLPGFLQSLEASFKKSMMTKKDSPNVSAIIKHQISTIFQGDFYKSRLPFSAPKSFFNRHLGPSRATHMLELSLEEMKRVAAATDASVNDIFLAITGAALRRYLKDVKELPDESLVAMVPLALKTRDESAGNQLAVIHCQLDMGNPDPVTRLAGITQAMEEEKHFYRSLSPSTARNYTNVMSLPQMAMMMTGTTDKVRPNFNVMVSNVNGPSTPRYLHGAQLERFIPMSVVTEGNTLNITAISYAGKFQISVLVSPSSVPKADKIRDYLGDEFTRLRKNGK